MIIPRLQRGQGYLADRLEFYQEALGYVIPSRTHVLGQLSMDGAIS